MIVEDYTASISDEALQAALERMVAVVAGIVPYHLHCPCGRLYALQASAELGELIGLVRRAMRERTGEEPVADTSRFSLIEVD